MAYPHLNFNTETVILEKFFIGSNSRIPREILKDLAKYHQDHTLRQGKVYTEVSPVTDEMLIGIRAYLLKGMHEEMETMSVSYPATWFDHLKASWLESGVTWKMWLAGKLTPPQFVTEAREVKTIRVCPHNDTYFSESQQHIQYLLWRNDDAQLLSHPRHRPRYPHVRAHRS
jgi:hypothetical protein